MANELKQTLYAANGRAEAITAISGGPASWDVDNTYAGTHDASDSTYDQAHGAGNAEDVTEWAGHVRYVLDSCTYSGTISFLRFKWRAKYVSSNGTVEASAWFSAGARGTMQGVGLSFANYYSDHVVDKDGQPWTQTTVNALTGTNAPGFSGHGVGNDYETDIDAQFSEFCVEVWGPEVVPQSVEVGAGAVGAAGIVIAAQSSVEVGAGAAAGAGQVVAPGAMTAIVGAGAVGSAGIGSPAQSFAYNTGLRVDANVLKIDGTNYNPLSIPATNYRLAIRHLRGLGLPHFAFAMPDSVGTFYGGGEFGAYVTFALLSRPPARTTLDDIHWLLSLHEVFGAQRELLSIGLTPSGRLVGTSRDSGPIMTPINTVPIDGVFREAHLELMPGDPRRRLFLDGQCLLDVTGGSPMDEPQPAPGVPVRVSLFNGRDGLSALDVAVAHIMMTFEDYTIEWAVDEGHGGTLHFTDNDQPPRLYGKGQLVATWWNGQPILASPEDQNANVKSAYAWKYITPYTTRRPAKVAYTPVGGITAPMTPIPEPEEIIFEGGGT